MTSPLRKAPAPWQYVTSRFRPECPDLHADNPSSTMSGEPKNPCRWIRSSARQSRRKADTHNSWTYQGTGSSTHINTLALSETERSELFTLPTYLPPELRHMPRCKKSTLPAAGAASPTDRKAEWIGSKMINKFLVARADPKRHHPRSPRPTFTYLCNR